MIGVNFRLDKLRLSINFIFFLFFVNIIINQPFMFISFSSRVARLTLEVSALFAFFVIVINKRMIEPLLWIFCGAISLLLSYYFSGDEFSRYVGVFNKFSFGVLAYFIFSKYYHFVFKLKNIWLFFWGIMGCWSILSFLYYLIYPEVFKIVNFGDIDKYAPYSYLVSDIGQVIILRKKFGILFGRSCGFFFEPIHLGFISWLNFLLAKSFFKRKVYVFGFMLFNLLVGLSSLSGGFVVITTAFLPCYFIIIFADNKKRLAYSFIWLLCFSILVVFFYDFVLDVGSGVGRLKIEARGIMMLRASSFIQFLSGHGFSGYLKYSTHAFSSAYLDLLLTQGFVFFILFLGFMYKIMKYDWIVLMSVATYMLLFNPVTYIVFYFLIIIGGCMHTERKLSLKEGAVGEI